MSSPAGAAARFPGLKRLLLPRRRDPGPEDLAEVRARALFQPPDTTAAGRRRGLAEFLGAVGLFEDLGARDLARLARIIHEREYADGEYICQQGQPAAAMFIVRRGVVEIVRRDAGGRDAPLALLEPPAWFDEPGAIGVDVTRWYSVRARGPVSLLALGKSDLEALIVEQPVLANKILVRLAGVMASRLQILIDVEIAGGSEAPQDRRP
jgi:CRP-like cAMP-binding protein